MVWLWLLAPAVALLASRLAVTRLIVPRWRAARLTDAAAAALVVAMRGLTLAALVLAVVFIARLPALPGILTALAGGVVYGVVAWRPIRAMFRRAGAPAGGPG